MHKRQIEFVVGLVLLIGILGAVYVYAPKQRPQRYPTLVAPVATAVAQPPLSQAMIDALKKSHGFQMLVSYTERGFEPRTARIKAGQTVRFTNNSPENLWVAATGASGSVYPGSGNGCGQSAFDSCVQLKPGEFWEFTFTRAGTWSYKNNADTERVGVVVVQ